MTLAAPFLTPWPWVSFTVAIGLLVGVGLMLTGLIRKSAGFLATGLVLCLLAGMAIMIGREQYAAQQERRRARLAPRSQPATRPKGE